LDTANDYRILVAEDAVERLERRVKSWNLPWPIRKKEVLTDIDALRKRILKIKYSFLPAEVLLTSEELKSLVEEAKRLAGILLQQRTSSEPLKTPSQRMALAEIRYSLGILIGLPQRIRLGDDNKPEYAVDVVGAEVSRVEKLTENLKVTRASAGPFALTVVTNLKDIRVGEVRAVAILPPVEFHGVISEAMYSSDPIDRKYIGKRVPSRLLSSELRGKVMSIVERR
jgi:predicted RNA-binding protein with EMAP domain